jgi:hypothetical protein
MAYGFGERTTPKPFRDACTKFVYVENSVVVEAASPLATKAKPIFKRDPALDKLLSEAVDTSAGDDGWAHLAAVGSKLSKLASDFDSRSWGFKKLTDLMKAHPDYDVETRSPGDGKPRVAVVRFKPSM